MSIEISPKHWGTILKWKNLKRNIHNSFKAELRDAALEIFAARGFQRLSLRDLAASLQISERIILRYFPDKESILLDGIGENSAMFREKLLGVPRSTRPVEAFRAVIMTQLQPPVSLEGLLAISLYAETSPRLLGLFYERRVRWQEEMAKAIAEWLGCLMRTDFRPAFWAEAMVSAILFAVRSEAKEAGIRAVFDAPEIVIDMAFEHLRGVTVPANMAAGQWARDGELPTRRAAAG